MSPVHSATFQPAPPSNSHLRHEPQLLVRQPAQVTREAVLLARQARGGKAHTRSHAVPTPAPPPQGPRQQQLAAELPVLQHALVSGAFAAASTLLRRHPGFTQQPQIGRIAGMCARAGDTAALRILFSAGVSVDVATAPDGDTPLFLAIGGRHHTMLDALIEMGANINRTDCQGITPLYYAAMSDNMVAVAKLVRAGARPDILVKDFAAIHAAIVRGYTHVAQLLFRHAGKETEDDEGQTPIQTAIRRQRWGLAEQFLAEGANIHHIDDMGCSVLGEASAAANPSIVRTLLEAGASCGRALNGPTALGLAVEALISAEHKSPHDVLRTVQLLLEFGADVDEPSTSKTTPLLVAATTGYLPVVTALVDAGADLFHHGDQGSNCTGVAAAAGHVHILQFLIERGASITQRDDGGNLPIHLAARHGRLKMLEFLIEHGQALTAHNRHGAIPLSIALYHEQLEAVRIILAKMNLRERIGRFASTPLHLVVNINAAAIGVLAAQCRSGALQEMLAIPSASGMTVYHAAAMSDDEGCLSELLNLDNDENRERNVSRATYQGLAPLDFALSRGSALAVRQILPHTNDGYFNADKLPEGISAMLALDWAECCTLLLRREAAKRCLQRHAESALNIICSAGFVDVIELLFPLLIGHVAQEPGERASNVLHRAAASQSLKAVRLLVNLLGSRRVSQFIVRHDENGRLPSTLAQAPGLRHYLEDLRAKTSARTHSQIHRTNRSMAERQVNAIWSRWESLFADLPPDLYPRVEKRTADLINFLRSIQSQSWYLCANASVREPVGRATQAVCARVATLLDTLYINHAVGFGMGHNFPAHSPKRSRVQLHTRLLDAAIPGSSRFGRSGMLALLELRQQIIGEVELLEYQPLGRYIVEYFSSELQGEGYARSAALENGGTTHFREACYVRAVLERRPTRPARLVSLYPVPREQLLGPLGVCRRMNGQGGAGMYRDDHDSGEQSTSRP